MSPSRKAALIGLWAGGTALFVGFLPIVFVTVFTLLFGHRSGHVVHVDHPQLLIVPMLAVFLAPIGLLFGILGLLVFVASIVLYVIADREEHPTI